MPILAILYTWGEGENNFIHKSKEVGNGHKVVGSTHKGGRFLGCKGTNFASEPGGIKEVAMWL
jgi:hypothetical protein